MVAANRIMLGVFGALTVVAAVLALVQAFVVAFSFYIYPWGAYWIAGCGFAAGVLAIASGAFDHLILVWASVVMSVVWLTSVCVTFGLSSEENLRTAQTCLGSIVGPVTGPCAEYVFTMAISFAISAAVYVCWGIAFLVLGIWSAVITTKSKELK